MKYKSSGSLGDIIYSIPCVLSLQERYGEETPVEYYLAINMLSGLYAGAKHPAGKFRLVEEGVKAIQPLLESQGFQAQLFNNEAIDVDLDLMRQTGFDLGRGNIPRFFFYAFHSNYDLSQPWLWLDGMTGLEDRVVVNRTSRYQNKNIDYSFLQPYKPLFVGLPEEYYEFRKIVPSCEFYPTTDLLQMASIIRGCKFFLGNQSVAYAIAEGLKCTRVLEVCLFAPNVQPAGALGFDFIAQVAFENIVCELLQ